MKLQSNFNCHICNTTSSGTFLHMFWECPVVISLWTHVNLVLSSLLRIDWSVNPSLCLLNDDSDLCISSMRKRLLFAGFTAVKKTIIQNWFTPHMCREAYWIRSLLQIVSCECTTARVGGARPSTIEAWQSFLLNIRNYLKEWLLCSCCPSLSPSLLVEPWDVECVSAVLFCFFILDVLLCCVWKIKKIKIVDNKKKILLTLSLFLALCTVFLHLSVHTQTHIHNPTFRVTSDASLAFIVCCMYVSSESQPCWVEPHKAVCMSDSKRLSLLQNHHLLLQKYNDDEGNVSANCHSSNSPRKAAQTANHSLNCFKIKQLGSDLLDWPQETFAVSR